MFPAVPKHESFSQRELAVGQFWKERSIYHRSLEARADAEPFIFFEGPPTANGMPHPGHCLTRAIKDLFPRYRTMRGYRCERKAGWDTHGLPVEVEVCKELGIHSKEEIEAYGIEPFIQKCQQSVWRYIEEWRRLTERIGFWVDMEEAYATYHQSYVESVWWSLKTLFDEGLLYQGHKIVWWWPQGGTALSAGEVGQGYREVQDPSVYVKFPIVDEGPLKGASFLVWTTTPWTLASNQFVAVHPDLEYSVVVDNHDDTTAQRLIIVTALVETISEKVKREFAVESTIMGRDLLEKRYRPPFEDYWQHRQSSNWHQSGAINYWAQFHQTDLYVAEDETVGETLQQSQTIAQEFMRDHVPDDGWQIVEGRFVTTDSGTGIVHIAPAFGEDDMDVLRRRRNLLEIKPEIINCVAPNGTFTDEGPEYCRGRWVKDCDKDIIRDLKQRGLLYHREQYVHDYPFCWRAEEDPLIQYPRESWFIRTTEFKDQMLANNAEINWLPEHIQTGRFGKFLQSNVDWALSRERYWGTPLPIWVCSETGQKEAIGCYEELLAKPGVAGTEVWDEAKRANPELPDDLRVHKPYIDAVTYDSPYHEGARMQRVTEVIDCWYDSGAMPFAQWGYQGQTSGPEQEQFLRQFPADFISEALDQTRGWFYSQLAISTLLFGENKKTPHSAIRNPQSYPHPFRNCIVLGLMLGEDGQKMSKSKRNYRSPDEIFDLYGADALRWYFFANQPPWTSIRYSEQAIKESIPEFLLRLWNVYSFFTIYANIDGFDPGEEVGGRGADVGDLNSAELASAQSYRPLAERGELDRWILSELSRTCATVVERMDAYDNYAACQAIVEFVDALSNWYVRRSRDRFWAADKRLPAKLDAYWTLYECLVTTSKLIAPFVPFLAESLWQNLAVAVFGERVPESVHLCDYPTGETSAIDETLSDRMRLVRQIASLGRQARTRAEIKVRQPLAEIVVVLADQAQQPWLEEHAVVIADELNVKQMVFSDKPEKFVEHQVLPNFKLLGPRLGKLMSKIKPALAKQSGSELLANIRDNGRINLTVDGQEVELLPDEVEVRLQARPGWAAANALGVVVILATELTEELVAEGLARDLVRAIQDIRKEKNCDYTDRMFIGIESDSKKALSAVELFKGYIAEETLADHLEEGRLDGECTSKTVTIGDGEVTLHYRTEIHLKT